MAAATLLGGYQRAIQLLESFAEGKPLPGLAAAESGIASTTEDREPTFSRLSFDKGDGSLLDDDMDGTLEGF